MPDTPAIDTAAKTVTIAEAKTRLDELLTGVQQGEEWLITTADGRVVAKLEPPTKRWKAFGMLKGQIEMSADFDEPLEDFRPYME